jgi:hypothetical protein
MIEVADRRRAESAASVREGQIRRKTATQRHRAAVPSAQASGAAGHHDALRSRADREPFSFIASRE